MKKSNSKQKHLNSTSLINKVYNFFHNLFYEDTSYNFSLSDTTNPIINQKNSNYTASNESLNLDNEVTKALYTKNDKVFPVIDVNLEYIKVRFNSMINSDITIREFILNARGKQYKSFLVYIDGMVDQDIMNNYILKPLILRNSANTFDGNQNRVISEAKTNNITVRKIKKFDVVEYVSDCLLPQNAVSKYTSFDEIVDGVNSGNCALFIDTINIAFDIEVKGFKQRGLDNPNNEMVIRGAQVGFTESLRTNTSLIRRYVNNENLIIESVSVGNLSKTKCSICYLKNVANTDLIAEVKYRINNIDIDYLTSSGQLEQLIEDNTNSSLPQLISTERPDRTANLIFEGRIAIIVNGSPYVLIAPAIFADFLASPEDLNVKTPYSNFIRCLRVVALVISLLLPSLYIAITNFHQGLIPTELLYAIVATRETVPFPIVFEIIVMEFAFELIREASIRVPSPVGQTIGIVGALILGQAAVEASIVSPILIIIVSLTAICSFAIPDFSLSFHFRVMRFIYIILAASAGFVGIAAGICVHILILCSLKSFGVPYLQTNVFNKKSSNNGVILPSPYKREERAKFLKTKRPKMQNKISMKWKY